MEQLKFNPWHATILRNCKLGFLNCKYLKRDTLHVGKHVIKVKPYHIAMLLPKKKNWPLWNIRDHIPLKYVTVQVNLSALWPYFKWDLCDSNYIGYATRHLFQRIADHRYSAIGRHLRDAHGNIDLIKNKTQTAVINILNLHILIMTWRFVCTLRTFSKVAVEI